MTDIPITQQQFLGASIRGFDINLGWGTEPSVLQVRLVEDDTLDEHFEYTLPGFPVRFQYNDWIFDGILDNYNLSVSESGNRLIDVTVTDPRRILEGVQLILDGYNDGVYGIPNLYNVFGWLESIEYGYAGVNDFGIPAYKIIECLSSLMIQVPIFFQGYQWYVVVDFTFLDSYFRISTNNMSFMDFIDEVCTNYNRDYFIEAIGNTMFIRTIDRSFPSTLGVIGSYLNNSVDYNQANQGIELQKVTTSKFLVGGQVEELHFQFSNYYNNDQQKVTYEEFYNNSYRSTYFDNMIYPYWGNDINGNAILGQGKGDNHWFILDGRALDLPGFNFNNGYPSDVIEMIAAASGFDNWVYYLEKMNTVDDDLKNLQYGKFTKLASVTMGREGLLELWKNARDQADKMLPKDYLKLNLRAFINTDEASQDMLIRVHKFVETYANEYYGRKFMVRIPDVQAKFDPLTQSVKTSLEPTTSGYLNSEVEANAVANGLIPQFRDFVKDDDGKIVCYVKFTDFSTIDFSSLSEDEYFVENGNLFVKAELELELVFLNRSTAYSPRAVITLPGPIYSKTDFVGKDIRDYTLEKLREAYGGDEKVTPKTRPGDNSVFKYLNGIPLIPEMAVIPLKNNYKTYGPWYNTYGGGGTCEFDQNSDLVPWNFGSFEAMNQAANSMVREVGLNSPYGETGEITLPGAPDRSIGDEFVSQGPYVTGIQVQFDATDGILTTYRMSRWATKIGKQTEQIVNQQRKLRKAIADQKRALRKLYKPRVPLGFSTGKYLPPKKNKLQDPSSPHHMIFSQVVEQDGGETASVVTIPFHEINTYLDPDNIEQVAGMSVDGLFRGFSTNPEASGIPKFTAPDEELENVPTSKTLNPFSGGDIGVMIHGTKDDEVNFNNDFIEDEPINSDDIRAVGLRAPLILVGFGYDINGKPVPNLTPEEPGDEFIEDYKLKQTEWKAGPLDARWDESRGVWVAGGSGPKIYYFQVYEDVDNGSAFSAPTGDNLKIFRTNLVNPVTDAQNSGIIEANINGVLYDFNYLFNFWWRSGNRGICYEVTPGVYGILQSFCQGYPYESI